MVKVFGEGILQDMGMLVGIEDPKGCTRQVEKFSQFFVPSLRYIEVCFRVEML